MQRILIIDDDDKMRRALRILLERLGFAAVEADTAEGGLDLLGREDVDLVMTDVRLPGMDGVKLLARIRQRDPALPVIVLTAYGTIQNAVEAMRLGAFDYVLKPFELDAITATIRKALELQHFRAENRYLRERLALGDDPEGIVAVSPAMRHVLDRARQVAETPTTVLITGETGVGKEVVARAIHRLSPRRDKLLVTINCAAIPAELLESELFGHVRGAFTGAQDAREGKFELAHGGTLFLDEIGDMPVALQAKLLRVLEDSVVERLGSNRRVRVDVRVVSSTNRDLADAVRDGSFREDLYYRLNVFHLAVPPLRERPEDVRPLAERLLARFGREFGKGPLRLAPDAGELLADYAWPGNVRELQNVMERAAVLAPRGADEVGAELVAELLPLTRAARRDDAPPGTDELRLASATDALERDLVARALARAGGSKPEAARLLGVSERTLWYKIKKHAL
jgi:two-component system response regulator AtoC